MHRDRAVDILDICAVVDTADIYRSVDVTRTYDTGNPLDIDPAVHHSADIDDGVRRYLDVELVVDAAVVTVVTTLPVLSPLADQ
jgi:hypothetical protein